MGRAEVDRTLAQFAQEFPPLSLYLNQVTMEAYLSGSTEGISNREVLLEEMLMLFVANRNPAAHPYLELFDDSRLSAESAYSRMLTGMQQFFTTQPPFGPDQLDLVAMLRSPALAVPYSLTGQLEFIRERWSELLGRYLYRLLSSLDLVKEEEKAGFVGRWQRAPLYVPVYDMPLPWLRWNTRISARTANGCRAWC